MNNLQLLGIQLHLQTRKKLKKSVSLCENLFHSHRNFTYDDSLPRDQLHNSQVRRRTYVDALLAINIYSGLTNVRPFLKKLDIVFHFVRYSPVSPATHSGVMSRHSCTLCKVLYKFDSGIPKVMLLSTIIYCYLPLFP